MAVRQAINEEDLSIVSGGVKITNDFGDHTVYKIGMQSGEYTHTFSADDYETVKGIVAATRDKSLPKDEDDANIMAALLEVDGLLSPL